MDSGKGSNNKYKDKGGFGVLFGRLLNAPLRKRITVIFQVSCPPMFQRFFKTLETTNLKKNSRLPFP